MKCGSRSADDPGGAETTEEGEKEKSDRFHHHRPSLQKTAKKKRIKTIPDKGREAQGLKRKSGEKEVPNRLKKGLTAAQGKAVRAQGKSHQGKMPSHSSIEERRQSKQTLRITERTRPSPNALGTDSPRSSSRK